MFFTAFDKYAVTRLMITWLNLDLGIEVCLFNGMTMVQKTWLQLGYVFYMWTLQIIIIFFCRRSTRCTRLFGENVNKVLSTLILLSFVKKGRIVQSIWSLNKLYVINSTSDLGLDRNMWLMDSLLKANICCCVSDSIALFYLHCHSFLYSFFQNCQVGDAFDG